MAIERPKTVSIKYFEQIFNNTNGLPPSLKKTIQNIIDDVKKHNGSATEKQYIVLKSLKTGNWKYSTKNENIKTQFINESQRLQKLAGISEIKIEPKVLEPLKGYEDEFEKAGLYFDEGILGGVGSGAHGYYDNTSDKISGRYLNEFNEDEFDEWYNNFNENDIKTFAYTSKEDAESSNINVDQLLSTLGPGMYDLGEDIGYIKLDKNGIIKLYAIPTLVSDYDDDSIRMFRLDSMGRVVKPKTDKEKIKNILQKNLQDPGDWFIV
jgi:hypothetical protein